MAELDFSPIGDLYNTYRQSQRDAARQQALAPYGGDMGLAQLMLAQQRDTRDFDARRGDVAFQHGITERQTKLAETQAQEKPQYMKDDSGNIVEILPYGKGSRVIQPTGGPSPTNPFAAPGKAPQEHEAKAALFADRIASSHNIITKNEGINSGLGGAVSGALTNALPEGITTPLAGMGALGGTDRQNMMNAQRSFINALLRRESGAAINAGEFASYGKEYFPQPGDGPEVLAQKRERRQQVAEGLMREAGKHYSPPKDFVGSKTQAVPPVQQAIASKPDPNAWRTKEIITAARQNPDQARQEARAAIAAGVIDRNGAIQRLRQSGVDPAGL